jgi:hypothetical protein
MWNFKTCGPSCVFFFQINERKKYRKKKEFKVGFAEDTNKRGGFF